MTNNSILKANNEPSFSHPYSGRYMVFLFNKDQAKGGYGDVFTVVNTLPEITAKLQLDPSNERSIVHVEYGGQVEQRFKHIDVLDMEERRFIDINELNFTTFK